MKKYQLNLLKSLIWGKHSIDIVTTRVAKKYVDAKAIKGLEISNFWSKKVAKVTVNDSLIDLLWNTGKSRKITFARKFQSDV